jgi:hypothetical protein
MVFDTTEFTGEVDDNISEIEIVRSFEKEKSEFRMVFVFKKDLLLVVD